MADALRSTGLEVAEDIGMSNFRVDLAARASTEHDWIGILLDGPAWAQRRMVSDRDALPTQVQTGAMGWRHLERVWLPAWIRSRSTVVQDVVDAAERALRRPEPNAPGDGAGTTGTDGPADAGRTEDRSGTGTDAAAGPAPGTEAAPGADDEFVPVGARPAATGPDEEHVLVAGPGAAPVRDRPEVPGALDAAGASSDRGAREASDVGPSRRDDVPAQDGIYHPAPHRVAGDRQVLDAITARRNEQQVREHLEEIIAAEGPVEAQRLARLLANRFGLQRVQSQRQAAILRCLAQDRRSTSELGTYYWPEDLDPEDFTGYRRTPEGGEKRAVGEIAPEEIGNAVLDVLRAEGPSEDADVVQSLNDVFGFNRTGREIRERYGKVLDLLERDGRIVRREAVLALAAGQLSDAPAGAEEPGPGV